MPRHRRCRFVRVDPCFRAGSPGRRGASTIGSEAASFIGGLPRLAHGSRHAVVGSARQLRDGLLTLFIRHTSASLVIQENADPDVRTDLEAFFAAIGETFLIVFIGIFLAGAARSAEVQADFSGRIERETTRVSPAVANDMTRRAMLSHSLRER